MLPWVNFSVSDHMLIGPILQNSNYMASGLPKPLLQLKEACKLQMNNMGWSLTQQTHTRVLDQLAVRLGAKWRYSNWIATTRHETSEGGQWPKGLWEAFGRSSTHCIVQLPITVAVAIDNTKWLDRHILRYEEGPRYSSGVNGSFGLMQWLV